MAESEATKIQIVAPQAEQPQVILEDGRIAGTIHCSELHPAITESDLFQYFSGPTHTVIDVKLMRDAAGHSLGHGFITFQNDAQVRLFSFFFWSFCGVLFHPQTYFSNASRP
jgi:hypothetical protein